MDGEHSFVETLLDESDDSSHPPNKKTKRESEISFTLPYQKLVVPEKMRSVYWKGFGFPANEKGEILTRQKIVCLYCQTAINYNRNTSNLRMHLESKHPTEFKNNILASNKESASTSKKGFSLFHTRNASTSASEAYSPVTMNLEGVVHFGEPSPNKTGNKTMIKQENNPSTVDSPELVEILIPDYSKEQEDEDSNPELETLENAVTAFIVTDLLSPCLVEGAGFKNFVSALKPGLPVISKTKIEEQLLPQCQLSLREAIIEEISGKQPISISLEEWQSGNGIKYFTLSVNLVKESNNLESRVLSTFENPTELSNFYGTFIETLQNWGVDKERIFAVVLACDNYDILYKNLTQHELKVLPCLQFILQKAISKVYEIEDISDIIEKCYKVETLLKNVLNQGDYDPSLFNYKNIWITTYNFLTQIIDKSNTLKELMEFNNEDFMTDEDLSVVKLVVDVLKPFAVVLDTLSEGKLPSMTIVKPFVSRLENSYLKNIDSDSALASRMKTTLRNVIFDYYFKQEIYIFLGIGTYLDPRFKYVRLQDEKDFHSVQESIKKSIELSMEENKDSEKLLTNVKQKPTGIGLLFENVCKSNEQPNISDRSQLEMLQYKSEQAISLTDCPMQWWSATRSKCPNLYLLNRNFACVPATAIQPQILPLKKRINFVMNRASISANNVDSLLFLHLNKKMYSFQE